MSGPKRKFSREFKIKVVQETESGTKSRAQLAREYELSNGMINKWIEAYRADPINAFTKSGNSHSETDKLKAKIHELEWALGRKCLEAEILKQSLDNLGIKKGGSMG